MKISTALLSVHDKSGIADFARALVSRGVRILSTGGTARALREAGVPLTEVSSHTGSPEILDGRVKTLHPKIHGGILAIRDNADHRRQLRELGIETIDLVAVNLYPFEAVIAKPDVSREEAIENIDIGGPSMVRSSAKNHRDVTIVTEPADYPRVLAEMEKNGGGTSPEFRSEMAVKAFAHTSRYDAAITSYLGGAPRFPEHLSVSYRKAFDLRYGENPHQQGAFYRAVPTVDSSVGSARVLGGKELSYNNLLDLDSAFGLVLEFEDPACVVVKHNNPCGTACGGPLPEVFRRARGGDPVSAYGGILAFNRTVDSATAEALTQKENFFEAVIAPGYDPRALEILKTGPKWGKNFRILEAGDPSGAASVRNSLRSVRGGLLVQTEDEGVVQEWKVVCGTLNETLRSELQFAMTVCKHVRSNAIVIASGREVVGVGAGQMSRLDSAEIAVRKAGDRARGAVAASDAFFPFPDALEVLARAGVRAVIHPGGSIRDEEVAAAAKKAGVVLVAGGLRHFRH